MENSQKPAVLVAVEELRATAKTPEDHAQVDAWEVEAKADRESALAELGHTGTTELVQLPDGSIETRQHVQEEQAAGHDASGPYDGGIR